MTQESVIPELPVADSYQVEEIALYPKWELCSALAGSLAHSGQMLVVGKPPKQSSIMQPLGIREDVVGLGDMVHELYRIVRICPLEIRW